ncbi:MAG: hypothetical protein ACRDX8_04515 [Acidimicrobiales bacterium]
MASRSDSKRGWRGWPTWLTLLCGAGLIVGAALTAILGAPLVDAQAGCDASGTPVSVHYATVFRNGQGEVSAVTLTGFPAACDGQTVTLQMYGNSTGNPSLPLSSDKLLSTADSALDPCTQSKLTRPLAVSSGAIALSLCGSGGPAGYAGVRELTDLSLYLPAVSGGVLGASTDPGSTGTVVPTTGAGFSLSDLMLLLGILLLLVGVVLFRRRGLGGPVKA